MRHLTLVPSKGDAWGGKAKAVNNAAKRGGHVLCVKKSDEGNEEPILRHYEQGVKVAERTGVGDIATYLLEIRQDNAIIELPVDMRLRLPLVVQHRNVESMSLAGAC